MTRTLPYSAYSEPAELDRERSLLFAKAWHYAGSTADFTDATSVPIDVSGVPVVLTKSGDEISALVNVCAHRGSIVCKEPGSRESLTCPYHAWRYGLDGHLINAPRSEREETFEPAAHSLERLPVGRWGPFVFVSPSQVVVPFEEHLGDLPQLVAEAGIDVDSLQFHHRAHSELRANWKICVENFLECYHCRVAHPAFAKTIDTSPDEYHLVTAPTFSTQYGPVKDNWSGGFDPNGEIGQGQFHLLYPNTAINIMPGAPNISIGPIQPLAADRTARFLDYFFAPETDPAWIDSMLEFDDQVGREDRVLVEDMQVGLTARPERRGTLFMDSEQLIAAFETYLSEVMG